MPSSNVVLDIDGPIATVTLARTAARNALTWEMYDALVEACDAVPTAGARVVIIRGSDGAFSSGTDIAQFDQVRSGADGVAYERRLAHVIERLEAVDVPTIASIDGPAVGGGCALAVACDLRIAADTARLGVPVARTLGNCLSVENLARLVDLVGQGRALELMFTGRLVPAADLDAETRTLAGELASRATSTLATTKAMLRRLRAARRPAPGDCDDLIAACYASADFREGVTAFAAKRRPSFS